MRDSRCQLILAGSVVGSIFFVESTALCLTITRIVDFDPRMYQVLELEVPCFQ
jgi:hypothetical protein